MTIQKNNTKTMTNLIIKMKVNNNNMGMKMKTMPNMLMIRSIDHKIPV